MEESDLAMVYHAMVQRKHSLDAVVEVGKAVGRKYGIWAFLSYK